MIYDQRKARQQYQNTVNNAQGQAFEGYIKAACMVYNIDGRAEIDKTPEPFRVMSKQKNGVFVGRFTAHAQPDFQGTLAGGRSIVFEAKYTTTDRIKRDTLTDEQMKRLARHDKLGAVAGVCIEISDKFYFVPWTVWRDMKQLYGRQYVKPEDIEQFRVRFTGAVMFLDYIHDGQRFALELQTRIYYNPGEKTREDYKERGGDDEKAKKEAQTKNDDQGYATDGI